MSCVHKILILTILLSSSLPTAQAASIYRSYHYFTIAGKTIPDLGKGLSQGGPFLQSTGQRHLGAVHIRFVAKTHYGSHGKRCRVTAMNVNVHATVFLPRWKQRHTASPTLALIWDTLSQDIKRHEESHLVIARSHASEIERQVKALPSQVDCAILRRDIDRITTRTIQHHETAKNSFDHVETLNFEKRFKNLLAYQLKKQLRKSQ